MTNIYNAFTNTLKYKFSLLDTKNYFLNSLTIDVPKTLIIYILFLKTGQVIYEPALAPLFKEKLKFIFNYFKN